MGSASVCLSIGLFYLLKSINDSIVCRTLKHYCMNRVPLKSLGCSFSFFHNSSLAQQYINVYVLLCLHTQNINVN